MIQDVIGDRTFIVQDHFDEDWIQRIAVEGQRSQQNMIINEIGVINSENGESYIVTGRQVSRPIHSPGDKFARVKKYRPLKLSPEGVAAATVSIQEKKVADTVLPFETNIQEFNPVSDINSDTNIAIISRTAADTFEGMGWDLGGLEYEYEKVESIAPNAYQSNIADDVIVLKRDIRDMMYRIGSLMDYYVRRGELPPGVRTIRALYEQESLPADLNRELADFSNMYQKYMELQRVIINESAGRVELPEMFIEPFRENRDEFIDEIITMGDNLVTI